MERFSQRESVHLRYSPQSSFVNDHFSPNTQHRNSDIDFNDVFGGPPRRSSMHEIRFSYSEATDNDAFRGDDGTVASRNSWTGLSEKPVFGEEGLNRMPYNTSENFFNDIFKGHESLSSSPRKREWDPYSSSPAGSRVLSPARPLPPQAEPFETSLPAQFSLPAKLTRGMDLPTFGSAPRSPYKSKDSASNGIRPSYCFNQGHEERNDSRSSYRQSLLSRELSINSKEPSDLIKHDDTDTGGNLEKESDSSEVLANGNQFHFSIYKWASKGVPLAMPICGGNSSRSRENSNTGRGTSSDGWIASERELPTETLHEAKLPSNDGVSASTKSFTIEHDKQNNSTPDTSTQDKVAMVQRVDPGDTTSYSTGEQTKSHSQSEIGLHNKLEKEASVVDEEAHKPELKPLCSLFYDNDYEQSNVEVTKKANEKERTVKSTEKSSVVPDFSKNVKKQDGKRASLNSAQVGKGSLQGPPMNSGDPGKIGVKGKVKEFVKIFNQESLSKSKINVDPSSQSSRWKDTGSSKAEKEANFSKNGTDEKIHLSSGHKKKSSLDAPIMVNGNLRYTEKQSSAIKNTNRMSNGTSRQKDASSTGSGSKAFVGDIDDSFQENVLVKELIQDENKPPKAGSDPEEIQVIDAKIRKWSNGKEGNIRSLLSTLQYVLWTESGWKTVPLVDIIDGNAVKRSYQKALLYLHPDKLQQKGATSQQKYIAEKVFDILQDAWTHFNSLGSL